MRNVKNIRVLHVVRRLVSPDLSELNLGYDLEHFKAMSELMLQNSVIFQSKDRHFHTIRINNLTIHLVPSLFDIFLLCTKIAKKYDLIVAQNPFVAGLISIIVGFFIKKPVVISVHGYEFTVGKIQSLMKGFVCTRATKIRAISEIVKNTVIAWGIKPEKIEIIEDRVDCEHFNPKIDGSKIRQKLNVKNKMIISVGSLIEIKGFDTLLEAAKLVSDSIGDVKFVILGDGPLKQRLIQQSIDLGINDKIIFVGTIPYNILPLYYAASDLFVHTSYIEAMGRVILEAQAAGKPVIATSIGGIPEAVTEGSAILLPPRDSKEFALAIIKLLNDDKLSSEMGEIGRKFVLEKFEFWKQEEKLISFYAEIIEKFLKPF
jgi:phosphatidylinositol alpha-1,6-mannosyltransferase